MANTNSPRRALTDLPINISSASHLTNLSREALPSQKRRVHEVDDPEYPSVACRSHILPYPTRPGQSNSYHPRKMAPSVEIKSFNLTKKPNTATADRLEEMDEGDSQDSSRGSICSLPEFDLEDETMASQETAATEITTVQPLARVAETLRLRLRVALFKVQTNQTNIPMSQLQISMDGPSKQINVASTSSVSSPEPEEPSLPKLLPAPVLRPTAYSARTFALQQAPSSPPNSRGPSPQNSAEIYFPWVAHQDYKAIQTSSPPDSPISTLTHATTDKNLTGGSGSALAARGLLDLKGITG